jgi:hypothetical protein
MFVLADFVDSLDRLVSRVRPLTASALATGAAILGILIIVFPVLLAWIVGLPLILGGLMVFGSIAMRVKWEDGEGERTRAGEQPGSGAESR